MFLLADDYFDRGDVPHLCAFANDLCVDADILHLELAVAEPLRDDLRHVDCSAYRHSTGLDHAFAGASKLDERAHGVAHHGLLAHVYVVGWRGSLHWCAWLCRWARRLSDSLFL